MAMTTTGAGRAPVAPHSARPGRAPAGRAVAGWLLVCCALLVAMVMVGGATRLTRSGLSIVEWQPITGALPPIGEQAWEAAFAKYRLTPEYRHVNRGMSLAEFKGIFWWEWFHRLLGRLIGVAFALPLAWFAWRRRIDARTGRQLAAIFVLGGLQGAMGWYMVMSGLVDEPRVSHLRLAAHLALAVLIFGAILWVALRLLGERAARPALTPTSAVPAGLERAAALVAATVFVMIVSGALVAGLRAGYAYNSFPLMHGYFVPPDIALLDPWYRNVVDNPATVQFVHRMIAWLLMLAIPLFVWRVLAAGVPRGARLAAVFLLAALALQVTLGVVTLLGSVPIGWAVAHQGGSLMVLAGAVACWQRLHAARHAP